MQERACELRISDWSSACALPISRTVGHSRVRRHVPQTRASRSFSLRSNGFARLPAKHLSRFQGHETNFGNVAQALDKDAKALLLIDNLDDDGAIALEDMAPVDMRRTPESEARIQNRNTGTALFPCAGCDHLQHLAIAAIGGFVRLDSQQLDCFSHDH